MWNFSGSAQSLTQDTRHRFAVALWPLFRYNSPAPQASLPSAVTSDAACPQPCTGRLAIARVEEPRMPIEQVAPECARLVDLQQEVEWLGSGFGWRVSMPRNASHAWSLMATSRWSPTATRANA